MNRKWVAKADQKTTGPGVERRGGETMGWKGGNAKDSGKGMNEISKYKQKKFLEYFY